MNFEHGWGPCRRLYGKPLEQFLLRELLPPRSSMRLCLEEQATSTGNPTFMADFPCGRDLLQEHEDEQVKESYVMPLSRVSSDSHDFVCLELRATRCPGDLSWPSLVMVCELTSWLDGWWSSSVTFRGRRSTWWSSSVTFLGRQHSVKFKLHFS